MRCRVFGTVINYDAVQATLSIAIVSVLFVIIYIIAAEVPATNSNNYDLKLNEKSVNDALVKALNRHDIVMPVIARRGLKQRKQNQVVVMAMSLSQNSKEKLIEEHTRIVKEQNRAPDSRYNINVTFSDLTPMDRNIPDTRPPICRTFQYDTDTFPKASIIIPFYNEAMSMLIRAVHSILNRTPDKLLEEIILVDDKSTDKHLGEPLGEYMKLLPKVKMIRNEHRVGLVVSRMNGARMAKAPIVIFIDAHTEANVGWLEPLLDELEKNPNQILQPFVDGIDAMSLEYHGPEVYHKGSFSWDLRYTWIKAADHDQQLAYDTGHPFYTPTLVGCAIAANKTYFMNMGAFDESLNVWGGENAELSFRTWMCGGKVATVTCSRFGHVFKNFPYQFDGNKEEIVQKNLIRVAETWMDGMKKYFYASTRVYSFKRAELTDDEKATLNQRKLLRSRLKCHNFEWYMFNIIPEVDIPPMNAKFYGEIMNIHTRACWEITEDYVVGMTYVCYDHKIIPKNNFALTDDGLLRYKDKCVKVIAPTPYLVISECPKDNLESFAQWELMTMDVVYGYLKVTVKEKSGTLVHWCIVQVTNAMPAHSGEQMPQLGECKNDDKFQLWAFTYAFDFSRVPTDSFT